MVKSISVKFASGNEYIMLVNSDGKLCAVGEVQLQDPLALRDWLTENFDPAYVPPLKPCPFCGSDNLDIERAALHYVKCKDCITLGPSNDGETDISAIAAWNKRSTNG